MNGEKLKIVPPKPEHFADVSALLESVGLPIEGVAEHLQNFFLAVDDKNKAVGCVGLEIYGRFALLRSVAVSDSAQGSGIGSRLTEKAIDYAKEKDITEILLLTTTAKDFFADRFGFVEVNRDDYDEKFTDSPEWHLPRCSSAVVMKLEIR